MDSGVAWSVLLSTTIFVIKVVKMLWTHEVQHDTLTRATLSVTLVANGKLANHIATLLPMVVKQDIDN